MGLKSLPDDIISYIFEALTYSQIIKAGVTCRRWNVVSLSNELWKRILCRDYKIPLNTNIRPEASGWKEEYRRLNDDTPNILSEELKCHDEVSHVSFSNSGNFFVTCSKDGFLIVWKIDQLGLTSLRFAQNMKIHGWQMPLASKFNSNDSLLLVAGIINNIHGIIAIYACEEVGDYVIICRIRNEPFDAIGAWCDLSGRLTVEDAIFHICRAYPGERHSHPGDVYKNVAFKFRNRNYLRILRSLIVSNRKIFPNDAIIPSQELDPGEQRRFFEEQVPGEICETMLRDNQFCLIFLCSASTSIPHQLGFKRLYPNDLSSVPVISKPDTLIEMHGHIVGIAQDREGRYLYVNVRSWLNGAVPTEGVPPPIDTTVEMRVVDLKDFTLTERVYRGHKGNTPTVGAFFLYVDVVNTFVGSGSEDGNALVWDKYYGCQLAANKHDECVSCVAFSPSDRHVMVSVGDDHKIKVWMSKRRARSRQNQETCISVL